ncbi:MAG TPA: RNA polymerase sigma factor [Bryobacteraceae bacterium]|nr:RNA polymerase sigma factor [Bryobacteraceae bacterium]
MQPHPVEDLESLMAAYQQGDRVAAEVLIERVSPQLHRFFMAQVVSRRYADDLLQETWLRIHEARHSYRPGEPVLPWIYAIARHTRVDSYRKVRRTEIREQQVDILPDPAQGTGSSPPGPDLEALLGTLPESQREVIVMLKVSEMTLEQVARATSSSVGSVKQKAHRAYQKLRQVLLEMGFGTAAARMD